MKNFFFVVSILSSIAFLSCSNSGTGPDPDNGGDNEEETPTYNISVNISPTDAGTISPSADSSYKEGKEIELQANTNKGYVFTGWSGDVDSTSDNPLSLAVDQDYSIKANFEIKNYELIVNTEGEGSVSEEVLEQKSKDYEHGTIVELTANPAEGYKFVEWQGDVTGTENPAQITVDSPEEVTAVFAKKNFTLSIELSGQGSVTKSPDQTEYKFGSAVELTASATGDWAFDKWQGDTTGSNNPITITMDSNKSVTALFENNLFAGGSGTEENPYQISTVDQLQAINKYSNAHYEQINDIDASNTSSWNSGEGFKPIGDEVVKFKGSYNGNNKKISNLYIERVDEDHVGLFGYTENATLENIKIVNADITGGDIAGCLVGYTNSSKVDNAHVNVEVKIDGINSNVGGLIGAINNTEIQNSSSSGIVTGSSRAGGLVASSSGSSILNSHSINKVEGAIAAGGLVGNLHNGTISNSYATGNVTSTRDINSGLSGGLVGQNWSSSITNSYATGDVYGASYRVGGLIGSNRGNVDNSYSTGDVTGEKEMVGGFVGINSEDSAIRNCYSISTVTGVKEVGGFVGLNRDNALISSSFSVGLVKGQENVGGFVGTNGTSINSSFWDTESTNQSNGVGRGSSNGTIGLTTSEMTGSSAEDNMSDFNWSEIWVTTDSYPTLFWE